MIKCNHYSISGSEFLIYGENPSLPEFLKAELLNEDIDPSEEKYRNLPIINGDMLVTTLLTRRRTRDKILEEEHIISFDDLSNAYVLYMDHCLSKPARIRKFVFEKYTEVIELVKPNIDGNIRDSECPQEVS